VNGSHRIDAGLLVGGVVQPGTSWILRDSRAWWGPNDPDTRDRRGAIVDVAIWHWTGGRPFADVDAARRVFTNVEARKREDGSDMDVSFHFLVGWSGFVWQLCDLAIGTVHAGDGAMIRRSVGIECAWPGYISQARKLRVEGHEVTRMLEGTRKTMLRPSDAMEEACARLAATLSSLDPATGARIPRQVPGDSRGVMSTRFSAKQARAWKGHAEHFHLPVSAARRRAGKLRFDSGTLRVEALAKSGFRIVEP